MAKILIIDDEAMVRYSLKIVLENAGHEVVEAENGVDGLSKISGHSFDVVVTDIIMPEKEGVGTIIEMKTKYPSLPVIAISGGGPDGYTGYLETAKALGADRTLEKPVSAEALLDAVANCLSTARS